MSTASPPKNPKSTRMSNLYNLEIIFKTFSASEVTSFPTPSPGNINIFII